MVQELRQIHTLLGAWQQIHTLLGAWRQIHTLLGAWQQIHTDISEICKKLKSNVLFGSLPRRSASTLSVVRARKFLMKRVRTLFENKISAVRGI